MHFLKGHREGRITMCNFKCNECPKKCCGALRITSILEADSETRKEQGKMMSEEAVKVSGCGSPKEPEDIRQNAAILSIGEKVKFIGKWCIAGIILTSAVGLFLFGKITELQRANIEGSIKLEHIERQLQKLDKSK
jgi:hypothetical protein